MMATGETQWWGGNPKPQQGDNPAVPAPIYTQRNFQMTRIEKLKELEATLYAAMQEADSKSLASIARQYRETLSEIEDIEGADNEDEISKLLSECDGEPNSNN